MKRLANARIHLAHDWLVGLRGGERVLDRLARLYGPTTLYTLVDDGRPLTDAISACRVVTSSLQDMPGAKGKLRRWYLPLMMQAVESIAVEPCDLLISTSSAVMKSIRVPEGVPHLCYCHSPARYVWGQGDDYAHGARGRLRAAGLRAVRTRFREWDRETSNRVTRFIANSHHTAARIRSCYDRDAVVIHPPVRTELFTPDPSVDREEWYLIVGALEPYKRTDLAIRAAIEAGARLRIVGDGSQRKALKQLAKGHPNIEFLGRVDDHALIDLYRGARALIHPQTEDFGIIAVEAQACGCPVLAYAAGGALETVTSATGVFFDEQTPEALADAMRALERSAFNPHHIRLNAQRFSEERFDAAIRRIVASQIDVSITVEVKDTGRAAAPHLAS